MSIGYILGYIFNLPLKQRISVAIEGGIQNGTGYKHCNDPT
jgi:predicted Na+-dependent transporter